MAVRDEGNRYPPLSEYGVVGDRHTAALVAHGSVDWWCPGRFDEPSVCARILDRDRGGHFLLRPVEPLGAEQRYDGDSNVLRTDWTGHGGRLRVHDLMPLDDGGEPTMSPGSLLRVARAVGGDVRVRMRFSPRPEYGASGAEAVREGPGRARLTWPDGSLDLAATKDLEVGAHGVTATWDLREGEVVAVAAGRDLPSVDEAGALDALRTTRSWWQEWSRCCEHEGPYRDAVVRSVLALGALSYAPTGAVVAAPTTSLPEWPGAQRNWDYRYVWMRDAAFAVDALEEAGHREQALRLGRWIRSVLRETPPGRLDVLYRVDASPAPEERSLDHLEGHRGSRPVRVGNSAVHQFQLDVYGELVECLHLTRRIADDPSEERDWDRVRAIVDGVCDRWREPDQGIWEMRSPPRHFVLSKVMAWVAVDRGLQAVRDLGVEAPVERWTREADSIRESVLCHGYDEELGSFVQSYGSKALDAANLLIPILGFLPPDDERIRGTVRAVQEHLTRDGLVRRYLTDDGVGGPEACFTACSFWLVEALAQLGQREEGHRLMRSLLDRATPLGLYAEGLGPRGRHLGNFPQALSHIALVSAAVALERADRREETPSPHREHARGRGWSERA